MPPETPLISVIIPAYQAAATLGRALDSALRQDYPALEVIVVDDGSTDTTRQVVAAYVARDPRVRYFWQTNQGHGAARNYAVAQSNGAYLALLDADDEWLPGKLQLQAGLLKRCASIGLVFTNSLNVDSVTGASALFFDIFKRTLGKLQPQALPPDTDVFRATGNLRPVLYEAGFINTSTVMMRADLYRRLGGMASDWRGPEDLDLWLRLARAAEFAYCTRQFAIRYLQPTSGSRHSEEFTKYMIAYYHMCLRAPDYADLWPQARQSLRKKQRLLIFHYGRHRQPRQAWAAYRRSLADGFDALSTLSALAAWLGPLPFMAAGRFLWP